MTATDLGQVIGPNPIKLGHDRYTISETQYSRCQEKQRWQTKAWKGERVNAQAVLWTKVGLEDASITVSDLKSGSSIIPSSAITTNFVRYVMTDELNKDRKGGCGHRENKAEWDSSVVADVLDIVKIRDIKARTTQPIWMNIWVPQSAKPVNIKGH